MLSDRKQESSFRFSEQLTTFKRLTGPAVRRQVGIGRRRRRSGQVARLADLEAAPVHSLADAKDQRTERCLLDMAVAGIQVEGGVVEGAGRE